MNNQKNTTLTHLVTRQRHQDYSANRNLIIPGILAMSIIMTAIVWGYQDHTLLLTWLTIVVVVCCLRYLHMHWYAQNHERVFDYPFHENCFNLGILIYGLCWSFAVLQFSGGVSQPILIAISLLSGIISAASVVTLSGSISFFLLFNIPVATAALVVVARRPDIAGITGSLVVMFYLSLLYYAVHMKRTFIEKIGLETENENLVIAEETGKLQLEKMNRELEERIKNRTAELTRLNQQLQESEEKLRKSEILYQQAEQMSQLGHWEWDHKTGQMVTCSDEYASIFEMTREEMIKDHNPSEKYIQLVHPDDRARLLAEEQKADLAAAPLEIEYRIITKNGAVKYVNERSDVTVDESGKIVRSFGTTQDITARKTADLALQKSQSLYQHAERLADIGHWEWDEIEGCMLGYSDQYMEIFEISLVERLAASSPHIRDPARIHPEDMERLTSAEAAAVENAEPLDIEYRFICKNGKEKYIRQLSDVITDESGKVVSTYGIVQDITKPKSTELMLRKHHEMFEQAERLGRLGHWEWDQVENRLMSCSPQFAEIFGMTQAKMMETAASIDGYLSLVHIDDRELRRQVGLDCFENIAPMNITYRIVTSKGDIRYVRQLGNMATDDEGQVIRSFGTLQDITQQKNVELALRKRQAMFEEAERLGKLGHWKWDEVEERMISCSQQYAEIFDMNREEMMDVASDYERELRELVHPDDRMHRRQMDIYSRQMGLPMEFEYRIITKNGDVRYVQTSSDMELDSDGRSIKSFGTLQDITERKNIELQLRKREAMFERAEELGKLGHWEWDEVENYLVFCSSQYASIFDMTVDEMMESATSSKKDLEHVHPEDWQYVSEAEENYYDEGIPMELEYRIITSRGDVRHVRQMSDVKLDDSGTTIRSFGTLQDITEIKQQQEKFENAEVIGNFGHWEWDIREDRMVYCSQQYANIYERSVEDCLLVSNSSASECRQIHPDDRQRYQEYHENRETSRPEREIECRIITGGGNTRVIREISRPVYTDTGELVRTMGTVQDITEQVEATNQLNESRNQFKHIFNNAPIGMALISQDGVIIELNQSAADMLGYTQNTATGMDYIRLTHPDELSESVRRLGDMAKGLYDHYNLVRRFRHRDGHYIWVDMKCSLMRDPQGNPSYVIVQGIDVTEQRDLSEKLSYQASHDSLTALINRREFESRLDHLIQSAAANDSIHTFCYMDLDQFKIINDTFGHAAGDELLRQLCGLIQKGVRGRDTLARLGGDEFGLLMEHCSLDDALKTAESLRRSIDEFRFIWEERVFSIGISMGIVSIDHNSGSVNDLMKAADSACYMAKEQGRNRIIVHSETDEEVVSRRSEIHWASRIQDALAKDQLYLVGQSIQDLHNDKKQNDFFELLLRIPDDKGNLVSATAMLSAAERFGLITKIDEWVVEKACSSILADSTLLEKISLCSINLSGQSISNMEFLRFIETTIEKFNIPPAKICFEITETSAISNFSKASKFIETLRARGFHFALDDFGTGLSSFAYLKKLPVDFIKIDGAFIKDILKDPTDMSLVKSINELGHVYGKRTIAEYVETPELLEAVRNLGIDFAQGYCIGRPLPVLARPTLVYEGGMPVTQHR